MGKRRFEAAGIVMSLRIEAEVRIPAENWGRDKPRSGEDQFRQLRRRLKSLKAFEMLYSSCNIHRLKRILL